MLWLRGGRGDGVGIEVSAGEGRMETSGDDEIGMASQSLIPSSVRMARVGPRAELKPDRINSTESRRRRLWLPHALVRLIWGVRRAADILQFNVLYSK